jgi:hypothetical protein
MRKSFILFIFFAHLLHSQTFTIKGKITSSSKETLPFATIYVKGTTLGTNSNEEGDFTLKLKPGEYELVFQYVGYAKKIEKINLNENKTLNIVLDNEGVALKEIEVKAGENPANIIIRKAIKKRKYYLSQVEDYSCNTYIKGLQRLKGISKGVMKMIKMADKDIKDSSDLLGVVYLSESQSEFYYKNENNIKEIMLSSKVSGSSRAFSFNQYRYLNYNFYENQIEMQDVSNRPFISPINENAFLYYRYKLLGSFFEDGKEINKIEVIPKRETDPVFSGVIYIQENTWRLTSINLFLTKKNKINFVDTITVKQILTPVAGDSIWLPTSSNMSFEFSIFGFRGDGYFNTVLYNYNLDPKFEKKFFSDDIAIIAKGANKKDSAYWEQNRPIPLTEEEKKDYHKKDSVAKIVENPRYIDSMDRRHNKFKFREIINGYAYERRNKNLRIEMPGIKDAGVQYNTVEGINVSYKFDLVKSDSMMRVHRLNGKVRYGFANLLWGGELDWNYLFNHNKFSAIGINVKNIVEQYNNRDPISQIVNSAYTLFLNKNFMKLYKEAGASVNFRTEIGKGLNALVGLKYAERTPLVNKTDLLIRDDPKLLFTSNDPLHPTREDSVFQKNNAFFVDLSLNIRFKQRYYNLTGFRFYAGNKYPKLSVFYRRAIPLNKQSSDFDLIGAQVRDEINCGLFGDFKYNLRGGYYTRVKNIYFMDYRHFNGNQTIISTNDHLNSFKLLSYYGLSTKDWYAELHTEHHFNGFIINKIPLVKKLFIQEVVGFHALVNDRTNHYFELDFGLKNIFKFVRLDYVISFKDNNKLGNGFLIGINQEF